ncbi:unnamed protein product [Lactuca virosa]|uniref:Uncharacterized protein n=1 Tax=Lactuca virosa TaxID=75947 RepID=A0AAU9M7P4_9ASTR|nr:unnamed protein product [Lactuca virosa]
MEQNSCCSVRDPFLAPLDKKDLAEAAKAQFLRDHSDHFALVRAYEGWKVAEHALGGYEYYTGLVEGNMVIFNAWSYDENLIRLVICYGLYPGISSVIHNEKSFSLKTMEDGQVLLHSNSVDYRDLSIPFSWLVFNEKIKVNSVFIQDTNVVSDSVLLLFGGSISKGDIDGHLKMLGGYLEFFMEPSLAEMYLNLRKELDELFQYKLLNPKLDLPNKPVDKQQFQSVCEFSGFSKLSPPVLWEMQTRFTYYVLAIQKKSTIIHHFYRSLCTISEGTKVVDIRKSRD